VKTPALQVFAGPRALRQLRERGLRPADVRVVPAAAGGPKGLILNALDRFLFGHWLPQAAAGAPPLHLVGASIGAWRMACAALPDADAALAALAQAYIHQDFGVPAGRTPTAANISSAFQALLAAQFEGHEAAVLAHPRHRLHVVTSHGRGLLLRREGRGRTALGYAGAYLGNLASRRALGGWLERVVFSDPRTPLPFPLDDLPSQQVALTTGNLGPAILASGSIPFVLNAVHDIPGAPRGAYWDGGITDYHLHLKYAAMADGLVLYPHFQRAVVPGWLYKALRHRHRATPALDNVVLLAPHPEWVRSLPGGKLPDRQDFKAFLHQPGERIQRWQQALAASAQLADEAAALLARDHLIAQPL
jgi:hypothetical protein